VHVEAVGEGQHRALLGVRRDVFVVDLGDVLVRQQDHDDVGGLDGVVHFGHFQAGLLNLVPRGAALAQADGDVDARIAQVLRVRVALRAVADDGNVFALDQGDVGVFVVENFHDNSLVIIFNVGVSAGLAAMPFKL